MRRAAVLLCLAAAAWAADVKVDNEFVRVQVVNGQPRGKTEPHKHDLNRVLVYLDAGETQVRQPNGLVDKKARRAGEVSWSPAGGMHSCENPGATALRTVEVELKKPPSGRPFRISSRDPLKADPKHYSIELENSQVRVMRVRYPANYQEPLHEHFSPGRITIPVGDVELKVATEGSGTRDAKYKAGDATWSAGPIVHGVRTGNTPAELIVIELK